MELLLYIEVLTTHRPLRSLHPPPCLSFTVSSFLYLFPLSACLQECSILTSLGFYHACFGHYITIMVLLVQEK